MAAGWIRQSYNPLRDVAYRENEVRHPSIPYLVSAAVVAAEQAWHSWDFDLERGLYRLSRVSSESFFWNYVNLGYIGQPNQLPPILIADRLATVHSLPDRHDLHQHTFRLDQDRTIRIESWAQHHKEQYGGPLPLGFTYWIIYKRVHVPIDPLRNPMGQTKEEIHLVPEPRFAFAFRTVSRVRAEGETLIVGVEDGPDTDFNDLVVRLERLGD